MLTDDLAFDDVEAALFYVLIDSCGLGVRVADAGTRYVLAVFRGWDRVPQ